MSTVGDEAQRFLDEAAALDAFQDRLSGQLAQVALHLNAFNEAMEIAAIETQAPRRVFAQVIVHIHERGTEGGEAT